MNVNLFLLRSEVPPMVMWDPMGCPWTSEVPVPVSHGTCGIPWTSDHEVLVPVSHGTRGIAWDVHGPVRANIFFGRGFDLEIHLVFGVQLLELNGVLAAVVFQKSL